MQPTQHVDIFSSTVRIVGTLGLEVLCDSEVCWKRR